VEPSTLGHAEKVYKDERALRLSEMNLPTPDSKGVHRYQLIYVARKDKLAVHRKDMGDASKWTANQFEIWSGWQDTVAELAEMADKQREHGVESYEGYLQAKEDSHLVEGYIEFQEQLDKLRKNRSFSGPGGLRQRTGLRIAK
jgi:hypothetical protein